MSNPWDCLRTPVKTPIGAGKWKGQGTPTIELCNFWSSGADIKFGNSLDTMRFSPDGLRLLAEFCIELADQIERK